MKFICPESQHLSATVFERVKSLAGNAAKFNKSLATLPASIRVRAFDSHLFVARSHSSLGLDGYARSINSN